MVVLLSPNACKFLWNAGVRGNRSRGGIREVQDPCIHKATETDVAKPLHDHLDRQAIGHLAGFSTQGVNLKYSAHASAAYLSADMYVAWPVLADRKLVEKIDVAFARRAIRNLRPSRWTGTVFFTGFIALAV